MHLSKAVAICAITLLIVALVVHLRPTKPRPASADHVYLVSYALVNPPRPPRLGQMMCHGPKFTARDAGWARALIAQGETNASQVVILNIHKLDD
jgi:hypothetical protein